jgi:hypothetical protein
MGANESFVMYAADQAGAQQHSDVARQQVGLIPRVARQAIQSMRAASKSGLGAEYTKAE